jgi:hypothetical protein
VLLVLVWGLEDISLLSWALLFLHCSYTKGT